MNEPDQSFANPRLVNLYDHFDSDRSDLDHYLVIVDEFGARSVLDVGCGTGTFACLLAETGISVCGVDPAAASLAVAQRKPGADAVTWILGDATTLPPIQVDMAVMTGNVAQVFVSDAQWSATLAGIRGALSPHGGLVFEVRDPARRAWENWVPSKTFQRVEVTGVGIVETWIEVIEVSLPLVAFRHSFRFDDGSQMTSDSTLRFRTGDEITASLHDAGFTVDEVRDASDRPGLEWVFIASAGQLSEGGLRGRGEVGVVEGEAAFGESRGHGASTGEREAGAAAK